MRLIDSGIEAHAKSNKRLVFPSLVLLFSPQVPTLNEEQFHWLKVLNGKWKSASLNKSLNYFFDMKECHNYLNFMLSKESLNERWKDYIQDFMKWRLKM